MEFSEKPKEPRSEKAYHGQSSQPTDISRDLPLLNGRTV